MRFYPRKILITLSFSSVFIFCGCSPDEVEFFNLKVQGQITNEVTGEPIRFSVIESLHWHEYYRGNYWLGSGTWIADEDGRYDCTIEGGSEIDVKLSVGKHGFEFKETRLNRTADLQIINFQLIPHLSDYDIQVQGTVYDSNQTAVGEAPVTLWEIPFLTFNKYFYSFPLSLTTTDNNGFYQIQYHVDYGELTATVSSGDIDFEYHPILRLYGDTLITQDIKIGY